jgi:hypothetical protein
MFFATLLGFLVTAVAFLVFLVLSAFLAEETQERRWPFKMLCFKSDRRSLIVTAWAWRISQLLVFFDVLAFVASFILNIARMAKAI